MNTLHNIDKFFAQYAAIIIIVTYFGWRIFKHVKNIISEAKKEQEKYEQQYGNLEGLADIYRRHLADEREPNFVDHLKIALLKYVDAFRESTGKRSTLTIRLLATGAGVALLLYVVKNFVVGA